MKHNTKKLDKSQIEVEFELSAEEFSKFVDKALEHLKSHVKMDGFRAGQVPLDLVEKKVGQEQLLMEAGELAVKQSYAKYVNENNLEPIGEPEVQIKKIDKGSPFLFTVKVSVLPEIDLPDYKKIVEGVKGQDISVDEKEVEDAISYLQKSRAKFSQVARPAELKDFVEIEYKNENINNGKEVKDRFVLGEAGFMKDFEDNLIGMKQGEEKEFKAKFPENHPSKDLAGKESSFKVTMVSIQKMELPEINDEFAKGIGAFDTLVALKVNIKEGITMEKNESEKQRKRGEVLSKISEKVKFDIPEKMTDYEEEHLMSDFKNQITQGAGISFEKYLEQIKKTEEDIKKSFKMEAEKRIKNFLVLRQIGKAESIEVSNEELEEEMNNIVKRYSKDQIAKIDINQLKEYSKGAIFNEKVFNRLETFLK